MSDNNPTPDLKAAPVVIHQRGSKQVSIGVISWLPADGTTYQVTVFPNGRTDYMGVHKVGCGQTVDAQYYIRERELLIKFKLEHQHEAGTPLQLGKLFAFLNGRLEPLNFEE